MKKQKMQKPNAPSVPFCLQNLHIKYISFLAKKHPAALGCFSPRKKLTISFPVWRFATAEDLVARAAEGPERLKTELRLYRQQLEQVGVCFFFGVG